MVLGIGDKVELFTLRNAVNTLKSAINQSKITINEIPPEWKLDELLERCQNISDAIDNSVVSPFSRKG